METGKWKIKPSDLKALSHADLFVMQNVLQEIMAIGPGYERDAMEQDMNEFLANFDLNTS